MMTAALNLDGPANLELIHLDESRELAYWAHVLDTSEDDLRKVVDKVGPRAIDVRRHLSRQRHAEWQCMRRHSPPRTPGDGQASRGDPAFALVACAAAAVVTALGVLAHKLASSEPWAALQREHGCEAAAKSEPAAKQLRCLNGRVVRAKVADVAEGAAPKPKR